MKENILKKKPNSKSPLFYRDLSDEQKRECERNWAKQYREDLLSAIVRGDDIQIGEWWSTEYHKLY